MTMPTMRELRKGRSFGARKGTGLFSVRERHLRRWRKLVEARKKVRPT